MAAEIFAAGPVLVPEWSGAASPRLETDTANCLCPSNRTSAADGPAGEIPHAHRGMTIFFTDSEAGHVSSRRLRDPLEAGEVAAAEEVSASGVRKAARFDELLPWQRSWEVGARGIPNYAQALMGGVYPRWTRRTTATSVNWRRFRARTGGETRTWLESA